MATARAYSRALSTARRGIGRVGATARRGIGATTPERRDEIVRITVPQDLLAKIPPHVKLGDDRDKYLLSSLDLGLNAMLQASASAGALQVRARSPSTDASIVFTRIILLRTGARGVRAHRFVDAGMGREG